MIRLKINKLITGLPRGECAVEVLDREGEAHHPLVPECFIDGDRLLLKEVKCICDQGQETLYLVSLPGVALEGGKEITVHRGQLIA